jgi:hypothetical protein
MATVHESNYVLQGLRDSRKYYIANGQVCEVVQTNNEPITGAAARNQTTPSQFQKLPLKHCIFSSFKSNFHVSVPMCGNKMHLSATNTPSGIPAQDIEAVWQEVAKLIPIRAVTGSSLSQNTEYPEIFVIFLSPSRRMSGYYRFVSSSPSSESASYKIILKT